MRVFLLAVVCSGLLLSCGRNGNIYPTDTPIFKTDDDEDLIEDDFLAEVSGQWYHVEETARSQQSPWTDLVDLLFVLDTSSPLSQEKVSQKLAPQISNLFRSMRDDRLDFQAGVTVAHGPAKANGDLLGPYPIVRHSDAQPEQKILQNLVDMPVGGPADLIMPLGRILLTWRNPANASLFRKDSIKVIVTLSDWDDYYTNHKTQNYFLYELQHLACNAPFRVFSISPGDDCPAARILSPPTLRAVANGSWGQQFNMCGDSYQPYVQAIAEELHRSRNIFPYSFAVESADGQVKWDTFKALVDGQVVGTPRLVDGYAIFAIGQVPKAKQIVEFKAEVLYGQIP